MMKGFNRFAVTIALLFTMSLPAFAQTVPLGPRFVLPYQTVVDSNGVPIPGALLYFYSSGTNTPLTTYSDALLSVPNTNPVVASAAGVFPNIFLNGNYKVVLTDSLFNQIWTADPVYSGLSGSGGGTPGGINTQVQYNTNGLFGGISGVTTNGAGLTIAANDLTLSGVIGSTQCLQANTSGVVSGTGVVCGGGGASLGDQIFASPGAVDTLTITNTPLPTAAVQLTIYFDGIAQAQNTWSLAAGVVTFDANIPANVQQVEMKWAAPSVFTGVSSIGGATGTVLLGTGLSIVGQTISAPPPVIGQPGGRLVAQASSCSGASPVQNNSVVSAAVICYVPYATASIPISGTGYSFATLTLTPTNAVATNLYDIFAVVSSGSAALCYDVNPWTNASTRADGIAQGANGYFTNASTIATCANNGSTIASSITAGNATYLGTFYASATSTTSWNLNPAPASGGTNNCVCLYNAYNRVNVQAIEREGASQWPYGSGTWRPENNSTGNRISVVDGLGLSQVRLVEYMTMSYGTSTGPQAGSPGICVNCISTPALTNGNLCQASYTAADQGSMCVVALNYTGLGFTFYQAVEAGTAPSTFDGPDWYGNYDSELTLEISN